MLDASTRSDLIGLLAWYGEMGVDAVLAEEAVNWLERADQAPGADIRAALRAGAQGVARGSPPVEARTASVATGQRPADARRPAAAPAVRQPLDRAPTPLAVPTAARQRPQASGSGSSGAAPDDGVGHARQIAGGITSLTELKAALDAFTGCALKATATNTCVFRGAERARLMIIGEAPGREEDLEGRPFVGRAGQLLDRMLTAAGLTEGDVHITNAVYWRPPGNRNPTLQEIETLRPFLERQVELVAPEFVLALGGVAGKAVLGTADGIMKMRGKWRDISVGTHPVRAIATLHPAYLLRTPEAKRLAWRDLVAVRIALDATA
ncbi:MAG: uracil-DNA glycosylase [Hyphomicrobiaceae bacterium]|nr:uracil-DNA glycosylase [Hyphomicrobiaceae bacterium]